MTTYYVDGVSGSDGAAGTSFGTAWETIQFGLDNTLLPGDELRICATGTYTITVQVDVDTNAGTPDNYILITGANATGVVDGTKAIIFASFDGNMFSGSQKFLKWQHIDITLQWSNKSIWSVMNNGIFQDIDAHSNQPGVTLFFQPQTVLIQRVTYENTNVGQTGRFASILNSTGYIIRNCFAKNLSTALDIGGTTGYAVIQDSVFEGCTTAILIDEASSTDVSVGNVTIIGCLIFDGVTGIFTRANNTYVTNCTIVDNSGNGITSEDIAGAHLYVFKSIIAYNGGYGIDQGSPWSLYPIVERNNRYYQNTSGDLLTGSIDSSSSNGDPEFENRASDDYSLSASSPLIQIPQTNAAGIVSYPDWGALQVQGTGGAGGLLTHPGRTGGIGG